MRRMIRPPLDLRLQTCSQRAAEVMRGGSDFSGVGVSSFAANTRMSIYLCAMPYVTRAELIEIVPDLRPWPLPTHQSRCGLRPTGWRIDMQRWQSEARSLLGSRFPNSQDKMVTVRRWLRVGS